MIISVSFIQINTKINKNLINNNDTLSQIKANEETKNYINKSIVNKNYSDNTLSNWDTIKFYNTNETTFSLKNNEKTTLKINNNSNLTINLENWWPVYYINNTSSGVINTNKNITVTTWDLSIENLWWYTKIKITSDTNWNYLSQYIKYEITKKIWNKEIIKTKWKIKNF